jgi:hypothetical protein
VRHLLSDQRGRSPHRELQVSSMQFASRTPQGCASWNAPGQCDPARSGDRCSLAKPYHGPASKRRCADSRPPRRLAPPRPANPARGVGNWSVGGSFNAKGGHELFVVLVRSCVVPARIWWRGGPAPRRRPPHRRFERRGRPLLPRALLGAPPARSPNSRELSRGCLRQVVSLVGGRSWCGRRSVRG